MTKEKFKILILTDHSRHSASNSLYALAQNMHRNDRVAYIDVASRGNLQNKYFFQGLDTKRIFVHRVSDDFQFIADQNVLTKNLFHTDYRTYDLVLLRLPRPIDDEFLLWLEDIFESMPIINRPSGIIETSSKSYLLKYPQLCPPLALVKDQKSLLEFSQKFPIVLKPLREYGGKGIVKVYENKVDDGTNVFELVNYLKVIEKDLKEKGMLAMKYMDGVSKGDKRIIVVGGSIMAASLRLPPIDSWLCNVAQGGKAVPASVSEDEKRIVETIAKDLKQKGILIYGVDTLEDSSGKRFLSEINTLSVGGFTDAQIQTDLPIISVTVEKILNYAIAN